MLRWEFFKEDGVTVTGLDYDLSQLIAAKLGVKISFNKQALATASSLPSNRYTTTLLTLLNELHRRTPGST
jgi:ABC-type amino acid transport substrate-binding protein